jgi:hypothetical protein
MQREGSVVEHSGRKISHVRCGLDGEIAEHFVGAPSAEKADDIRVDLGAKLLEYGDDPYGSKES